jgi:hypothetical protein
MLQQCRITNSIWSWTLGFIEGKRQYLSYLAEEYEKGNNGPKTMFCVI